jgi:hypothetical protein
MASALPDALSAIGGVALTARLLWSCPSQDFEALRKLESNGGKRCQFDDETWGGLNESANRHSDPS